MHQSREISTDKSYKDYMFEGKGIESDVISLLPKLDL